MTFHLPLCRFAHALYALSGACFATHGSSSGFPNTAKSAECLGFNRTGAPMGAPCGKAQASQPAKELWRMGSVEVELSIREDLCN